ncbi:hypothetical protein GIB67_037537 [Kingdonia uniflora]|uniref:Uncharacterized protein n=1 Tax=Kingdonia uniflora TaxID=39325 RepID=A0A7J7NBI8_9MAGN|nr:hypothetical protein GIB67_037537 [Kingdonia uniflora]
MVLSNKKLKRKLRETLVETLATKPTITTTPEAKSESNRSLKKLLDSATLKPRLSKREKRRKIQPLQQLVKVEALGSVNGDTQRENTSSEGVVEKKGKKKRKRGEGGDEERENGVEAKSMEVKKKKKKKKYKKKNNNKGAEVEINKGVEPVIVEAKVELVEVIESQENVDASTKVYVGGIPYYSTEDDIQSFFEGCGTITEIDCMRFADTGKFKGIAMITFKTEAAAKRALALEGADMGGLYLKVQPYKTTRPQKSSDFAPKLVKGYNRVYVGNLSWDITEDDLSKLFSDCKISSIRFGEDKETKEFRGYAHVDFSDVVSMTMALTLDQKLVCGRPVKISCAVPKKEASKNKPVSSSMNKTSEIERSLSSGISESRSLGIAVNETLNSGVGVSESLSTAVTGKMKRRKCYECGTAGHLSSDCPDKKEPVSSSVNKARENGSWSSGFNENQTPRIYVNESLNSGVDVSESLSTAVTGKMKRRKCYECGIAGHLSSDCPNKKELITNSKNENVEKLQPVSSSVSKATETKGLSFGINESRTPGVGVNESLSSSIAVNEDVNTPLTGKMKRRKCYECGIPGHLSLACPNKKLVDPASS